jgi:hypothetical protein
MQVFKNFINFILKNITFSNKKIQYKKIPLINNFKCHLIDFSQYFDNDNVIIQQDNTESNFSFDDKTMKTLLIVLTQIITHTNHTILPK